jgi:hypothetical protein
VNRVQKLSRARLPHQRSAKQLRGALGEVSTTALRVRVDAEVVVHDRDRSGQARSDHAPACARRQVTAQRGGEILQRDIPELLRVQQCAVHVEQHTFSSPPIFQSL